MLRMQITVDLFEKLTRFVLLYTARLAGIMTKLEIIFEVAYLIPFCGLLDLNLARNWQLRLNALACVACINNETSLSLP